MKDTDTKILAFAHRGASNEFPENTMPSFERAVQLGVDLIETDIHLTKDNKFAVIHDDSAERTTNGTGKIKDYTMNELKRLDAGYYFTQDGGNTYPFRGKGITVSSLEEILEAFPHCRFNLDLKEKNPGQVKYFIEVIDKYKAHDRIITASEHLSNLKAVRTANTDIATSFSVLEILGILFLYKSGLIFLKNDFRGISLQIPEKYGNFNIITKSFVKQMHNKGLQVHVWTIDDREDMVRLVNNGVDGIMSNDPELLMKVLGR